MARRSSPPPQPPDWPHEKTHAALKKQLSALNEFRGRQYNEVESAEETWTHLTLSIFTHGFGAESNNVRQFHFARSAGEHYLSPYGPAPGLLQSNFNQRVEKFTSVLQSSIAELEMMMPEPEISGAYDAGDDYRFYRDLKTIVGFAGRELFIIDNYLDTQLFDVYMENAGSSVRVRVLTRQISSSLQAVAEKFAKRGGFELRVSSGVHDRVVFTDDRCFVIGSSIKDAAVNKPTYIVEHSGGDTMREIYEKLWQSADPVVKG
jgi:hypothetical protein